MIKIDSHFMREHVNRFKSYLHGNIYTGLIIRFTGVLVLFTFCRLLFYFYNRDLFPGMEFQRLVKILFGGLRFDLAGLLYLNLPVLILVLVPVRIKFNHLYQRFLAILFLVLNVSGLLLNLADMVYYRTTLRRSTLLVLDQFEHETNLGRLAFQFIQDFWGAFFIFLLLVFLMIRLTFGFHTSGPKFKNPWTFYAGGIFPLILFSSIFIGGVRGGFRHSTRPITISNAAAYATRPEDVNLILNTPFSVIRTSGIEVIKKVNYFKTEQELEKHFDPVVVPSLQKPFRPLNVVVIILESFSAEFVGKLNKWVDNGSYQGYTPFLDSLMEHSITYQYAFANGRKSIDAMPSLLCSIPSIDVPFVLSHYSNNQVNGLPGLLKSKGYHSAFFHGAPNGSMGFDAFAVKAGFDQYFGMTEYGNDRDMDGMWGIWDLEFLEFTAKKMGDIPEPFLATVFTVSSHHPFVIPVQFREKFKGGPNKMYASVQYTDYALKEFFNSCRKQSWFENTLFVITADHVSSEVTLSPYQTSWGQYAVPLVFYQAGMSPSFETQKVAQQIDVMPTVLGYLNYDMPYISFGKDLWSVKSGSAINFAAPVYQYFSDSRLIQFDGERTIGLYDFMRDKFLKHNLSGTENYDSLELLLKARLQQFKNRMVDNRLTIR
jgi:phosphoglycerol transferase MdoB-like AlkP superfamily enzyme